eukprot:Lithocolla_globosa_v1_NODE_7877_length_891_cov_16.136364.p2 type:complete len:147 gc:universal NODE_7877_length_891_cov_16.136364:373-813(+)
MDPVLQTWLSLSMIMEERSMRWVSHPPTSMAYFSTSRKPGVVLRVPATIPCHPCFSFNCCRRRALVATPLARASILSAGLSPRSRWRTGPRTMAAFLTRLKDSPSSINHSTLQPICLKISSKNGFPAKTPSDFPNKKATSCFSPTT